MVDSLKDVLFGLPRRWLSVLNVGAVLILCWMAVSDRDVMLHQAAADRQMFREELAQQRRTLEQMGHAVEKLAREVRQEKR